MLLGVGRLEILTREVVINARQPGGLRVAPSRELRWGESQAREPYCRRVHADLRIEDHVGFLRPNGRYPVAQFFGAALVVRRAPSGKGRLAILATAQIKGVQGHPFGVEAGKPAARE